MFITWRLFGTLPKRSEWEHLPAGKRFVAEDRALERLSTGPHFLREPRVAAAVAAAIEYGAETLHVYELHAWVIMSNHVHILIDPRVPLSRLTHSIKGYSARQANIILGRTGQPFWAIESYDHWVRNRKEFDNIVRYIEFNPVTAGLVEKPEDFEWSNAGRRPALLK
jgi:REP element-mobilizing transposase RayT